MNNKQQIVLFRNKKIRKIIFQKEWWFSVVDIIEVLTDSSNPRDYWYKVKIRMDNEEKVKLSTICRQLKLVAIFLRYFTLFGVTEN